MSDLGDLFRAVKAHHKEHRANSRQASAELLKQAGIAFEEKNGGAHLVIDHAGHRIDFWPGTGLWIPRGQKTRKWRGIFPLLKHLKGSPSPTTTAHKKGTTP